MPQLHRGGGHLFEGKAEQASLKKSIYYNVDDRHVAIRIMEQTEWMLKKNPEMRPSMIKSFKKMEDNSYVKKLSDLMVKERELEAIIFPDGWFTTLGQCL